MDIFIYLSPNPGADRDEIEDALEVALGEAAEVTGAGSGPASSNVDLHVDDQVQPDKVLRIVRDTLRKLGVIITRIVINRLNAGPL